MIDYFKYVLISSRYWWLTAALVSIVVFSNIVILSLFMLPFEMTTRYDALESLILVETPQIFTESLPDNQYIRLNDVVVATESVNQVLPVRVRISSRDIYQRIPNSQENARSPFFVTGNDCLDCALISDNLANRYDLNIGDDLYFASENNVITQVPIGGFFPNLNQIHDPQILSEYFTIVLGEDVSLYTENSQLVQFLDLNQSPTTTYESATFFSDNLIFYREITWVIVLGHTLLMMIVFSNIPRFLDKDISGLMQLRMQGLKEGYFPWVAMHHSVFIAPLIIFGFMVFLSPLYVYGGLSIGILAFSLMIFSARKVARV